MLILIFSIIIFFLYLSFKKFNLFFNPFFIEVNYSLFFLVIPQLILVYLNLAETFWLSDLIILLYILSVFLGSFFTIKTFKIRALLDNKFLGYSSLFLAFLFLLPTFALLFDCGISISGLRCYYETVVFSKFASFYELGKNFLFFSLVFYLLYYRKITIGIILISIIIVFSGSKFAILNLVIFFALFLEIYFKFSLKRIFYLCVPAFIFLLIYHFFQSAEAINPFLTALTYFDIYNNQSLLLDKFWNGEHTLYYGEIVFSSFYKFVPRIFWESKPFNYGFALLNYDIFPEFAYLNYMPSFGLGSLYADFGFLSVILGGFIAGFLRNLSFSFLKNSNFNNTSFILYYFSFSVFTFQFLILFLLLNVLIKKHE